MREDASRPQIDSAKIRVGEGLVGAIFTIGSVLIFLFGIPVVRYMFPAAIVLGGVFALLLRFARHETPGEPWLLSATSQESRFSEHDQEKNQNLPSISVPLPIATHP